MLKILDLIQWWSSMSCCLFLAWKAAVTIKQCHFLNITDCSTWYEWLFITNRIVLLYCKSTNSHSYNFASISSYLVKKNVCEIWFCWLFLPFIKCSGEKFKIIRYILCFAILLYYKNMWSYFYVWSYFGIGRWHFLHHTRHRVFRCWKYELDFWAKMGCWIWVANVFFIEPSNECCRHKKDIYRVILGFCSQRINLKCVRKKLHTVCWSNETRSDL